MNKKKIIITGASSALMLKLISLIDKDKYEIFGISRNIKNKPKQEIRWIKGDLEKIDEIKEHFASCHILIHAAAVTHTQDKEEYFKINTKGTENIVKIAKDYKTEKLVFISSRAAGFKSGAYGESKIIAENHIKQNFNNWIIFRPSEIFGGNKNEGIEKMINDIYFKKIIFCPANIPSKLYPVYIDDVASVIYDNTFNKNVLNRIITVNGKDGFSYTEFAEFTSKIFRKKIIIIPVPKFVLFLMKSLIEFFHLKTGIAPDQIDRLYSKKEIEKPDYKQISIEDYLKKYKNNAY